MCVCVDIYIHTHTHTHTNIDKYVEIMYMGGCSQLYGRATQHYIGGGNNICTSTVRNMF